MSKLPKLSVRSFLYGESANETEIDDLEQVKSHFDAGADTIVVVEGRLISSYDELIHMIAQGQFKGKERLEVMILPVIEGG